jgi:hypothetical protein
MSDVTESAGKRKYILVPPDTYELLISSFEKYEQQHKPTMEEAINFQNKITKIKGGNVSTEEKHASVLSALHQHNVNLCKMMGTGNFTSEPPQKKPKIEEEKETDKKGTKPGEDERENRFPPPRKPQKT